MRYKITLSYNGLTLSGWQKQNNAESVQEDLTRAVSILAGRETPVTGAGRTDARVNAVNYVAHFDLDGDLDAAAFVYKLNAILPKCIVVHSIISVDENFSARFSAASREYHYFMHCRKDPFVRNFSYYMPWPLDIEKMNRAASLLVGQHDFSCFEKTGSDNKTAICTVFEASWEAYAPTHVALLGYPSDGKDYLLFRIRANRFLRNMVRAIVGTLIEVGRGRREEGWITELIEGGERALAGESVPGFALFLNNVTYPDV